LLHTGIPEDIVSKSFLENKTKKEDMNHITGGK
jgi:hypothetical protein